MILFDFLTKNKVVPLIFIKIFISPRFDLQFFIFCKSIRCNVQYFIRNVKKMILSMFLLDFIILDAKATPREYAWILLQIVYKFNFVFKS